MDLANSIINPTFRLITGLVCRIHGEQLAKFPANGPLLVVANHINFLEVPVLYSRLANRPLTGFAKAESWNNPIYRVVFNAWDAIPLQRGEADMQAIRAGLAALEAGKILAIAPEGTRSGHGRLQRGRPGVVILASRSGAPILPLAYYGAEKFKHNLTRLRRTDFNVVVGNMFTLNPGSEKIRGEIRQKMVDEIMYQLAALLPPAYRGVYSDLDAATEDYLEFPQGSASNLAKADRDLLKTGQGYPHGAYHPNP